MNHAISSTDFPAPAPRRQNAGDAIDAMCRLMGIDPQTLPDADTLPPWPDEEANAFKRAIDEACEQVEEV